MTRKRPVMRLEWMWMIAEITTCQDHQVEEALVSEVPNVTEAVEGLLEILEYYDCSRMQFGLSSRKPVDAPDNAQGVKQRYERALNSRITSFDLTSEIQTSSFRLETSGSPTWGRENC